MSTSTERGSNLQGKPPLNDSTYNFSSFKAPITNTTPLKSTTLDSIYKAIIGDMYKAVTSDLRALKDKKERTDHKIKKLDCVTFSGVFKTRSTAGLIKHSNLFCIDLDDLEDVQATKDQVLKLLPPSLMFVSPSGNGLKVIYKININDAEHAQYFTAFEVFFNERLGVNIDAACKDIPRPCFLCHDSEAYFNKDAEVMEKSFVDTFYLPEQEIATEAKGEVITDVDTIIRHLKTWLDKKESFVSGNRNNYISRLAGAYNRYGISKSLAESDLLSYAQEDFTAEEIKAIVNSIYRNTVWHNTAQFKVNKKEEREQKEPTPLLPINGFPEYLKNVINEYVKVYNQPRDYIAASILFSTALAIGDKMELDTGKYKNIPLIWMDLIGNVSEGKSQPLEFALEYFNNKDEQAYKEYKAQKELYEAEQDKPKKERNNNIRVPVYPQYIIKDYTPETIPSTHQANPRGLCIYNDELKSWIDNFSRYNKSGEQSTMLSLFYRSPMVVNRVSKMFRIDNPAIYVAGGLQVDLLTELAKDNRAENGFLARMAHVFPDDNKKRYHSKAKLSKNIINGYHKYLNVLASMTEPLDLTLSIKAEAIYEGWFNKNVDISNETDSGYLKGVYGKLDVYALRFAITLHGMKAVCYQDESKQISEETMQYAVEITEYFRATALKVYKHIKQSARSKSKSKKELAIYLSELGNSQNTIANVLKVSQPFINKILKKK